jgi:transcription initiation factor TFIIB
MSNTSSEEVFHCPDCQGTHFYLIDSEKGVCLDCGLVVEINSKGDTVNEVEKDTHRILSSHENTEESLNPKNVDITFTVSTIQYRNLIHKWKNVAKYNDSTEKNLVFALSEITRIGGNLNAPLDVLERASLNYRNLVENRLLKRNKIRLLSVASLYLAYRQTEYPITLGEVARVSGLKKKDIGKGLKLLIRELKIRIPPRAKNMKIQQNASRHVTRDEATIMTKILKAASKIGITIGKNPESLKASAHYIASHLTGEIRTQRELSEIYSITQTTIRNRYKELVNKLNITSTL